MSRFDTHRAYRRMTEAGADDRLAEAITDVLAERWNVDQLVTRDFLDARLAEERAYIDARFAEERAYIDARFAEERAWTLRLILSVAFSSLAVGLAGVGLMIRLMGS